MGRREALLKQLATEPVALVERVLELEAQLAEAQAQIAELRRDLFGSKAEKLSTEQQAHLDALAADLHQEAQQPSPLIQEVLVEAHRRRQPRPPRHPLPPVRASPHRERLFRSIVNAHFGRS